VTPFGIGSRRRRGAPAGEPARPVLALDIDGVISLFGFEEEPEETVASFELIDGALHCISKPAGSWLLLLAERFDPVWATGWEQGGERISRLLDLPHWPALSFSGAARFGSANWKLEPLRRYAEGRPLAWVDDSLDAACYAWAHSRPEPTLLIATEPELGLQEDHVEALLGWARSLEADPQNAGGD